MAHQAQRAIEGHPAHQARMDKVPGATTYLPDAFIGFLPMFTQPAEETAQVYSQIIGNSIVAVIDVDGIHQFTVDIELLLFISAIADTHRSALTVSFQVIKG